MLALLLAIQTATGCAGVADCRAQAQAAAARGDYEIFHDLAWRTIQQGRSNDPDLMYLLARAQSLSGRPGDALVMLRRLADLGVATDAATSEDFARVRRLKEWPDLEARLAGIASPPAPVTPSVPRDVAAPASPSDAMAFEAAGLEPVALAHDAVSRRFVLADRRGRRLVVVDEVSRHVVTFVGAESSGFLDDLTSVAIDARRGDLWVASAARDGSSSALHKLQLVSGRVLQELRAPKDAGSVRLVAVAIASDGTAYGLDGTGSRLYRARPGARTLELALRLDARDATALTVADDRVLYVASAGGLLRVDLASRASAPVASPPDLAGFDALAWRAGSLVGLQRASTGHVIVRIVLDAAGTRVRSRTVLATTQHPVVGALARDTFYYLADQAIRRVVIR